MKNFTIILATVVVFWNVENFFDYFNGGQNASDIEFSPLGTKHWTKKRFLAKANAVSKTLFYAADTKGALPDIVAFAELENGFVLKRLLSETALRKTEYRIVHYDSEDHRGIDVGLLYNASSLELVASAPLKIPVDSTRDILLAQFVTRERDSIAVLVNHFPSKYGVTGKDDNRMTAAERLLEICDSLDNAGWKRILALGDFNEQPDEAACASIGTHLCNLAINAKPSEGTIKFNGHWELIDQAFVTGPLADSSSFEILKIPFLLEKDSSHSGLKPRRTYIGPRYNAGISDHLPVCVTLP